MDYGKAAYMKTEELEARLDKLAGRKQSAIGGATEEFALSVELQGGAALPVTYIGGADTVTVFAVVTCEVLVPGTLCLYIDGKTACSVEVFEGKQNAVLICSVPLSARALLELRTENGLRVKTRTVRVSVIGKDAAVEPAIMSADAALTATAAGLLLQKDGALYLKEITGKGTFTAAGVLLAGDGAKGAAYGYNGDYYFVYIDSSGGLYGVKVSGGNEVLRQYIPGGYRPESVGLHVSKQGIVIGYIKDGKIYLFECAHDFDSATAPVVLDAAVSPVEKIKFAACCAEPVIVYSGGGRSYLRLCENRS